MTVLLALLMACAQAAPQPARKTWSEALDTRVRAIALAGGGELGVYVKDLRSGLAYGYRADEAWYVASGVKVPIAIEVLHQIERRKFTLDSKIPLKADDYVDGAGATNLKKPGAELSVRFLLRQMLIHSDNTASDLLLKKVGIGRVNESLAKLTAGFAPITTLADVRRRMFGGIFPQASALKGRDFLEIKKAPGPDAKVRRLQAILKVTGIAPLTLDAAYAKYYGQKYNTASLRAYGSLLERIARGEALGAEGTSFLVTTMERAETGRHRLRAGFPAQFVFAHKTGTQYRRVCDLGFARPRKGKPSEAVVIAACTRDFPSLKAAENALKEIGAAVAASGVLEGP